MAELTCPHCSCTTDIWRGEYKRHVKHCALIELGLIVGSMVTTPPADGPLPEQPKYSWGRGRRPEGS